MPYLTAGPYGPFHLDEELTREEFETLTRDLLESCRTPVEQALHEAEITPSDLYRGRPHGRRRPDARSGRPAPSAHGRPWGLPGARARRPSPMARRFRRAS
ncbi:Hsp70 family protein [Streptomyces anulatus]|uniref:Hsp70 family protein n=1 Tax=Streptomyces anulatus TaxID=1892 RepID=UPI00341A36D9